MDRLDIALHLFETEMDASNTNHNFLLLPNRAADVTYGDNMGTINSVAQGEQVWQNDIFYRESLIKSDVVDLDVTYEGEGYTIHGQIGQTTSEGGTNLEAGAGFVDYTPGSWDVSGDKVILNASAPIDTSAMVWNGSSLSKTPRTAEEDYFQLDLNYEVSFGPLTSIDTGVKTRSFEFEKDKFSGSGVDDTLMGVTAGQYGDGFTADIQPDTGGGLNQKYQLVDMSDVANALLADATFAQDRSGYGKIEEDTLALYVQANFESDTISGNFGIRYAETDLTSISWLLNGDGYADDTVYKEGNEFGIEIFKDIKFVDVRSRTIGKGFAGAMKRYNFRGLRATHGVSVSHRSLGSTGGRQDPGKVFKNKKMAGHMGDKFRTIQNIEIIKSDLENDLLYLKGSIPGSKNAEVLVKKAVKNIKKRTITEKIEELEKLKKTPDKKKK